MSAPHAKLLGWSTGLAMAIATAIAGQACYLVDNPEYVAPEVPVGTNVLIRVTSTTDEPVALARVTVAGETVVTDGAGFIRFDEVPDGRFTARVDAPGYTSAVVSTEISDGASAYEEVRLFPLGEPQMFDAQLGGPIAEGSVRVVIPPNSLVDTQGDPVSGEVAATIVGLDPSLEGALDDLPCPLHAKTGEGNVLLRSIAMAEISLTQEGMPVRLADGAKARIELAIPDAFLGEFSLGQELPAWYLDLDAGTWRENGVGVIEENEAGEQIWVASVDHFSWHNCDTKIEWEMVNCFVTTVDVEPSSSAEAGGEAGEATVLSDVTVTLTDSSLGAFKDRSTSLMTGQNRGSNCMVYEMGASPTLSIGDYDVSLDEVAMANMAIPGTGACFAKPTDDDYEPDAANASCPDLRIHLPASAGFEKICSPGASRPCPERYSGPTGTEGVGICRADVQYCIEGGLKWSECGGEVTPQTETCTTVGIDDDCNGLTDDYTDGQLCACPKVGEKTDCYTAPIQTRNVGVCRSGQSVCELQSGVLVKGQCTGEITPTAEDCSTTGSVDEHDENCDGEPSCTGTKTGERRTNATIYDLAVGPMGEVYALGHFRGSLLFDSKELSSPVGNEDELQDTLLVKLGPDGAIDWVRSYGGVGDDYGHGIALSRAGDPVITGSYTTSIELGTTLTNESVSPTQIFVATIDRGSGDPTWSRSYGAEATGGAVGYDVAVEPTSGAIFVTGTIEGGNDFGASFGKADAFVVALSEGGTKDWALTYGGGNVERTTGIVARGANVTITGYFYDSANFGNGTDPLTTVGSHDIFVAQLDASDEGNANWSTSFGSPSSDIAEAIAVDSAGKVFVTGHFHDRIDFGSTTWDPMLPAAADPVDFAFVVGLEPVNGDVVWSRGWVGNQSGDEHATAIAVDSRDYVIFTGYFTAMANFGGSPTQQLSVTGGKGIMVVKLANNGDHVWSSHPGDGTARALAIAPGGQIHTGGDGFILTNDP